MRKSRSYSLMAEHAAGKAIGTLHDLSHYIYLHEDTLEAILEFSDQNHFQETGGFLLGEVFERPRPLIEIRQFLPAKQVRSDVASLTFTHDTWATLHREIESRYPDDVLLGWQHTHPGYGVFLSAYDLFIHKNFFRQAWQVALVVDPKRCEFGFFQWRDEDVVDCGFVCIDE